MCCRAIKTKLIGVAGIAYQCPYYSKQVNTSKMHLFLSDEVLIDGVKETQNQSEKQLRLV